MLCELMLCELMLCDVDFGHMWESEKSEARVISGTASVWGTFLVLTAKQNKGVWTGHIKCAQLQLEQHYWFIDTHSNIPTLFFFVCHFSSCALSPLHHSRVSAKLCLHCLHSDVKGGWRLGKMFSDGGSSHDSMRFLISFCSKEHAPLTPVYVEEIRNLVDMAVTIRAHFAQPPAHFDIAG